MKSLFSDADTGMEVYLIRYAAGFMNAWHAHPHGHGMFVLDGVLRTRQGEYGPRSFVWFPEGGWMEDGATDDSDGTFVFITNKPFAICYQIDDNHPCPNEPTTDAAANAPSAGSPR